MSDNPFSNKSDKVVTESYYVIKLISRNKKESYFVANKGGSISATKNIEKAKKFLFYGLKDMEAKLGWVMKICNYLKLRGYKPVIVGGDIKKDWNEVKQDDKFKDFPKWKAIIKEETVFDLLKIANANANADEEMESFLDMNKFLIHVREIEYNVVIVMAVYWNTYDVFKQANLAVNYAGEYSASRFMIFMDYLSNVIADIGRDIGKKE